MAVNSFHFHSKEVDFRLNLKVNNAAKNIKRLREEKGLTRVELAHSIIATPAFITKLEKAEIYNPTSRTWERIAVFFKIDTCELFKYQEMVSLDSEQSDDL